MGFVDINSENFNIYLTPMARERLYTGKGGDLQIEYFSLHDGDINYTKSKSNEAFVDTPAGKYDKVPNLRGNPSTIGVNGCQIYELEDFIMRNQGMEEKCPAGFVKGINGECVEIKYIRQQNKEITKKLIKSKKATEPNDSDVMGGARIVTPNSNNTSTSTSSSGGGGGY